MAKHYDRTKINEFVYELKHRNLSKAYDLAEEYILTYPDDRLAKLYMAEILVLSGRKQEGYEMAKDCMTFSFHNEQSTIEAYTLYGNLLNRLGRKEEAIEAFNKAIDVDGTGRPYHPIKARVGLINVYLSDSEYDKALKVIADTPYDYRFRLDLQKAIIYTCIGRYDEALNILKNLNTKDRESFTATRTFGNCYLNIGEYDKAIKCYRKMVNAKAPNYVQVLPRLVEAYLAKNEPDIAYDYAVEAYENGFETESILALVDSYGVKVDPIEQFNKANYLFGIPDLDVEFTPEYIGSYVSKIGFVTGEETYTVEDANVPLEMVKKDPVKKRTSQMDKFINKYGYK